MRLLYFWFDNHKQLNKFESNLGSVYSFHFSNNYLFVNDNKIYIEDFFERPLKKELPNNSSLNISAIVGENGSGKTTVLDFLSEIMSNNHIETDYVLVYSVDNNLHLITSFNKSINVVNNTSRSLFFCISPINFQNHLTILFSNIFDAQSIDMFSNNEKPFFKNITTNYMIGKQEKTASFLNSEFEKQIFFVHEYKEQLNIQNLMSVPDKIYLSIFLDEANIAFSENLDDLFFNWNNDEVIEYFNYSITNEFYKGFYSNCLKAYFIHIDYLLREYQITNSDYYEYMVFLDHYSPKEHNNIFDGIYIQIKDDIIDDDGKIIDHDINDKTLKSFFIKFNNLKEDYKRICDYFISMGFNDLKNNTPYIFTNSTKTEEFITLYQNAFKRIGCIKFTWSEMSSGEYGMLSLFSRFHHILKELKKDQEILGEDIESYDPSNSDKIFEFKKDIGRLELNEDFLNVTYPASFLLLIDEGDLYFHPQWQKDWLNYFIRLSNLLFKKSIQIILTTHSPFVLSDFPNSNVIFLRKTTINNSLPFLDGGPKTFASNIIELFSNSFFIQDGLIGSFAKEKINLFIQDLLTSSSEEVYMEKDYIKKFIDTIGEPLIRNKIFEIYQSKLELYDTEDDINRKIALLEQEIRDLKRKGSS